MREGLWFSTLDRAAREVVHGGCQVELWSDRSHYGCTFHRQHETDASRELAIHMDTASSELVLSADGLRQIYRLERVSTSHDYAHRETPPVRVHVERCAGTVARRVGSGLPAGLLQAEVGAPCDAHLRTRGKEGSAVVRCWLDLQCEGSSLDLYEGGRGTCAIDDDGRVAQYVDARLSSDDGNGVVVYDRSAARIALVDRAGAYSASLHVGLEPCRVVQPTISGRPL
ncbi:MAG: hypothetical protein AAF411_11990 [Myxococcota bacterium]